MKHHCNRGLKKYIKKTKFDSVFVKENNGGTMNLNGKNTDQLDFQVLEQILFQDSVKISDHLNVVWGNYLNINL